MNGVLYLKLSIALQIENNTVKSSQLIRKISSISILHNFAPYQLQKKDTDTRKTTS